MTWSQDSPAVKHTHVDHVVQRITPVESAANNACTAEPIKVDLMLKLCQAAVTLSPASDRVSGVQNTSLRRRLSPFLLHACTTFTNHVLAPRRPDLAEIANKQSHSLPSTHSRQTVEWKPAHSYINIINKTTTKYVLTVSAEQNQEYKRFHSQNSAYMLMDTTHPQTHTRARTPPSDQTDNNNTSHHTIKQGQRDAATHAPPTPRPPQAPAGTPAQQRPPPWHRAHRR
jgi:hypothetical protein